MKRQHTQQPGSTLSRKTGLVQRSSLYPKASSRRLCLEHYYRNHRRHRQWPRLNHRPVGGRRETAQSTSTSEMQGQTPALYFILRALDSLPSTPRTKRLWISSHRQNLINSSRTWWLESPTTTTTMEVVSLAEPTQLWLVASFYSVRSMPTERDQLRGTRYRRSRRRSRRRKCPHTPQVFGGVDLRQYTRRMSSSHTEVGEDGARRLRRGRAKDHCGRRSFSATSDLLPDFASFLVSANTFASCQRCQPATRLCAFGAHS